MENAKCYAPQILVGTEGLPREQWLEYRRKGIGGSDAAAVLGISPFRTGRDLYYDKLNIVTADDAENWVQLEVGTLLEPLVAKIFAHKTGYKIYRRPFMFRHPQYPWMLADLDYMVELPDGTTAILEIKTTNYNAKDNWWYNGEEIVPIYYESQGRHYMAVMNIDRVYFCCLYGNSEDEAIIRRIDRDMAYQQEVHTTQQTESVSDAMSLLQALSGGTAASEPDPVMPQKAQEVPSETAEPAVTERAETAQMVKPNVVDMPAAASTAAAPKYSDDMTVDEILSLMTEEEAAELVVTTGVNKGWTMAQVSEQRPSSLKYYAYLCEDCGNIMKAAAMLLMGGSQQLKAS